MITTTIQHGIPVPPSKQGRPLGSLGKRPRPLREEPPTKFSLDPIEELTRDLFVASYGRLEPADRTYEPGLIELAEHARSAAIVFSLWKAAHLPAEQGTVPA